VKVCILHATVLCRFFLIILFSVSFFLYEKSFLTQTALLICNEECILRVIL